MTTLHKLHVASTAALNLIMEMMDGNATEMRETFARDGAKVETLLKNALYIKDELTEEESADVKFLFYKYFHEHHGLPDRISDIEDPEIWDMATNNPNEWAEACEAWVTDGPALLEEPHPRFSDWQYEVANGYTKLDFDVWLKYQKIVEESDNG